MPCPLSCHESATPSGPPFVNRPAATPCRKSALAVQQAAIAGEGQMLREPDVQRPVRVERKQRAIDRRETS